MKHEVENPPVPDRRAIGVKGHFRPKFDDDAVITGRMSKHKKFPLRRGGILFAQRANQRQVAGMYLAGVPAQDQVSGELGLFFRRLDDSQLADAQ